VPRPPLAKLESFKPFAVEDLDDRFVPGDPPRREFRYRVRPRTADVNEIPRFKLVYFNPRIVPAARGYQTTYAEPGPLTVKPRTPPKSPEVPDWMLEEPTSEELHRPGPTRLQEWLGWLLYAVGLPLRDEAEPTAWWASAVAAVLPPAVCIMWWLAWRRAHPDAARLTAGRRSRAASVALKALGRSGAERADLVAVALTKYLHDRVGLPSTARTPAEVQDALGAVGPPSRLAGSTVNLMHRCDAARFAPPPAADVCLVDDARQVILDWEAAL
jgi:hypothetical protein